MLLRHKMFLINSQVEHPHSVAKWSAISSFLLYSAASLHLLFQMWLLKMGIWSLLLPIFLFLLLAMETQCKVHVCRQLVRCLTEIFTNRPNSKVQKPPSQLVPPVISMITSNKLWNTETHKMDQNPPGTNHKPWPFKPIEVKFCSLRGPKKAIISWLLNLKSAVICSKIYLGYIDATELTFALHVPFEFPIKQFGCIRDYSPPLKITVVNNR